MTTLGRRSDAAGSTSVGDRLSRLPRDLHPVAWWLWALSLAAAASRTTNPLLLLLVLTAVAAVVAARRTDAPWARGLKYFLYLGLAVIVLRVLFRALLGGGGGPDAHVLVTLPSFRLPDAAAGITIGGPVTLESLLAALYDGLRLATMLVCLGAANALANPKRMLRTLPGALYEVGMAVVVALTMAPQLIESILRVRRARRLRGGLGRGPRALGSLLLPVLEDALDRSLGLAAAMDSRGYGRRGAATPRERLVSGSLVVGGLLGICAGLFGLLGGDPGSRRTGLVMFLVGSAIAIIGMVVGGRQVQRTRYRPDPWRVPEWAVAASGAVCVAVIFVIGWVDPMQLFPAFAPVAWPTLPLLPTIAVIIAATPVVLAPPVATPPRRPATGRRDDVRKADHLDADRVAAS